MYYAILIYAQEGVWERLTPQQQETALDKHRQMQSKYNADQSLGPVMRLEPVDSAVTLRQAGSEKLVLDGPFAETKEHLLGIYMVNCNDMDAALEAAAHLPQGIASYEVRPVNWANVD